MVQNMQNFDEICKKKVKVYSHLMEWCSHKLNVNIIKLPEVLKQADTE